MHHLINVLIKAICLTIRPWLMIMRNLLHNIYINLIRLWAMSISSSTAAIIPYISLSRDLFPLSITCGTRQTRFSNIENCCYCLQGVSFFFLIFWASQKSYFFMARFRTFYSFLVKLKIFSYTFLRRNAFFKWKKHSSLQLN